MPVINTGSTAVGFNVTTNFDTYFVNSFNLITNTGTAFDIGTFDNVNVNVQGTIIGTSVGIGTNAAGAVGSAFDTDIIIGSDALVSGFTAIDMEGGSHTVYNNGEINSYGIAGIRIEGGSNAKATNSGLITGQGSGIFLDSNESDSVNSGHIDVSGTGIFHSAAQFAGLIETSINTGTITAGGVGIIASGIDAVTNAGTIVANSSGILASGQRVFVQNSGDITAQLSFVSDSRGIGYDGTLGEIQNTGTVTADYGIFVEGDVNQIANDGVLNGRVNGIVVEGDTTDIVNTGQITASQEEGILVEGTTVDITNSGSITTGGDTAISVTQSGSIRNSGEIVGDVEILGINGDIENSGDILGGVLIRSNVTGTLQNSGTVNATRTAVQITGVDETVVNSGEITATFGNAILFGTGLIPGGSTIVNTGLIATGEAASGTAAIQFSGSFSEFTNAGTVIGDVNLTGVGDYDGRMGEVQGRVTDGIGDGTLLGSTNAENEIFGGDGNDRIVGGMQDDVLDGGDNTDTIYGRGGDDAINGGRGGDDIWGGSGDDTIDGENGNDDIFGNSGNDTISGGNGGDRLFGGADQDTIDGGAGNDVIGGGRGDDMLTGGIGNDDFVFRPNAGDDVITDFTNGADQIDLSAFNATFAEVATASSGGPAGVTIDLDALGGNGSILLDGFGFALLDATDFIL